MANSDFRPAAGNFGEVYIAATATLSANPITASSTQDHYIPIPAAEVTAANQTEMLFYKGAALTFGGTASSTAGTVTAQMFKRSSGGTFTAISNTVTIPTGTGAGAILAFPILTTATDNARTLRPNAGDTLVCRIVASSTVSTQPTNVRCAAKLAVLR